MSAISELVLLVVATAGAGGAALFAILWFLRAQRLPDALTAQGATQILRAETDIVRAAVEDQARGLRQELGHSLKGFQELTLAAFGTLRDGIDAQVRGFGERLDAGTKAIDERAAAISTKLNDEMAQMRSEANTNRETLRTLIEQKLDHSIGQQADASKVLRDELGGNFHRLGTRVSDSLTEAGQIQKERLENVTGALTGLTEKLEKAQDSLRTAVESRLDAIRQESATKLEEMRQTVDEKLQTTLEGRLGESFNRVVEQLERVHKGIGEIPKSKRRAVGGNALLYPCGVAPASLRAATSDASTAAPALRTCCAAARSAPATSPASMACTISRSSPSAALLRPGACSEYPRSICALLCSVRSVATITPLAQPSHSTL